MNSVFVDESKWMGKTIKWGNEFSSFIGNCWIRYESKKLTVKKKFVREQKWTGKTPIGNVECSIICEALKRNTTLSILDLSCEKKQGKE